MHYTFEDTMTSHIIQISLFVAGIFLMVPSVVAQYPTQSTLQSVTIPDTEVHSIHSTIVNDDFELWIAQPQAGFVPISDEPLQVLYLLDANLFFGTAVEMTRLMHKLYGELPPLLIVGIAYPTDNGFQQSALRTRDFTPSEDAGMAAMTSSMPQMPGVQPVEPAMGGADRFLTFIEQEVKPFIDAHYQVDKEGEIVFGSSLGGLFVAHTLLHAPASFDHYIMTSPALWWNQGELFHSNQWTTDALAENSANVFIAAGGLEESADVPGLAAFKMVSNARKMANKLSELMKQSNSVLFDEIEDETHTSVVPVALTRGLRKTLH